MPDGYPPPAPPSKLKREVYDPDEFRKIEEKAIKVNTRTWSRVSYVYLHFKNVQLSKMQPNYVCKVKVNAFFFKR